ncbi:ribonuclease P protein component [Paeniglutamicibacter cryotolerans]|uniref:Ribonuclease P protein component n=1 Tax=Paeniglutamicibacter cryotolerans TaxID=670079 RepID=A0A839QGU2_9MICC|nr:ribonuclease P protein component [Paeniglutamicibacter cryotolerans]
MRFSQDFAATVRSGTRTGRRNVVLYARLRTFGADEPTRFGFIVSKAVGNAVHRNLVKRRFRALAAEVIATGPVGLDIVIRALPGAAEQDWSELGKQVNSALGSAVRKAGGTDDSVNG